MSLPTLEQIDRIARLGDPVLRNLQITQCYYEISRSAAALTGGGANWCTFATWASKQAGQTIRQEDLRRAFAQRFNLSAEIGEAVDRIGRTVERVGAKLKTRTPRQAILRVVDPTAALARAADAVARGNRKVFEEIGREFGRFIKEFRDDARFDADKTARFCAALRSGDPPEGQRLLCEAFTAYCEARFGNGNEKAELMLLANLSAGFHEQIRLQPEIAEALDASVENTRELKRRMLAALLPGLLAGAASALSGLGSRLDPLLSRLVAEVDRLIRQVITDHLMTLRLSGGEALRLGRDVPGSFPATLAEIRNPRLRDLVARVDVTPDSLEDSGAADWGDLADRMHYIADFFRVYQERPDLFDAPFTLRQVELLKSGMRPEGPL